MKSVRVWGGIALVLVLLGIIAVVIQEPLLMIPSLCGWTPVIFFLGWAVAKQGLGFRNPIVKLEFEE